MATIAQEFSSFAGEDTILYINVTDEDGAAVTLTTVTEITFKGSVDYDTAAFCTLTKTAADITLGNFAGTDDQVQIVIGGSNTAAITTKTRGRWDCYITDASGNDRYIASGPWVIYDSL